jgi:cyclophilin family peptidyl-prolyl cis-trans isomerase
MPNLMKQRIHTKYLIIGFVFLTIAVLFSGCGKKTDNEIIQDENLSFVSDIVRTSDTHSMAVISTVKGKMAVELYDNEVPLTVENFKNLVAGNFYNGLDFYNVQEGFKVQTGDPTGIGTGDSGTDPIPLETNPDLMHDSKGVLGMAHYENDVNSATSQFYITLDALPELDRKFAVFGKVVKGAEVLDAIEKGDVINFVAIVDAETIK